MSFPARVAPLLIVAVLFPFAAMVVGNLRKVCLAALLLDVPFRVDVNLWFREDVAKLGSVEGLNLSITTICLIILYLLWASERVIHRCPQPRLRFAQGLPLFCYTAIAALTLWVARDPILSLFQLVLMLHELLLFLYIASTTKTKQDVLFIVTLLTAGLVIEGGLIVIMRFAGLDFAVSGLSTKVDAGFITEQAARLGGTLGSPNNAAAYLAVVLPIAMGMVLTRSELWRRSLALLGVGCGGLALVITLSRGGWAAFSVAAAVFCFLAWRRGQLPPALPVALGIMGILLMILFQDAIATRLAADDKGAAFSRVPLMYLAFRMIADNPLLGVGANNFAFCISEYLTTDLFGAWRYTVHNKFLLVWAELGIFGLATFLWFLLSTLRCGWRCWQSREQLLAPLALGLTAAVTGHAFHMLAEAFNGRPLTNLLGICAGLLAAMLVISKQENEQIRAPSQSSIGRWRYA
jgi:O-antigen ligase